MPFWKWKSTWIRWLPVLAGVCIGMGLGWLAQRPFAVTTVEEESVTEGEPVITEEPQAVEPEEPDSCIWNSSGSFIAEGIRANLSFRSAPPDCRGAHQALLTIWDADDSIRTAPLLEFIGN